jgi:hypothetical protein
VPPPPRPNAPPTRGMTTGASFPSREKRDKAGELQVLVDVNALDVYAQRRLAIAKFHLLPQDTWSDEQAEFCVGGRERAAATLKRACCMRYDDQHRFSPRARNASLCDIKTDVSGSLPRIARTRSTVFSPGVVPARTSASAPVIAPGMLPRLLDAQTLARHHRRSGLLSCPRAPFSAATIRSLYTLTSAHIEDPSSTVASAPVARPLGRTGSGLFIPWPAR